MGCRLQIVLKNLATLWYNCKELCFYFIFIDCTTCAPQCSSVLFVCFFFWLEPICAIGHGVAGLCPARREDGKAWSLKSYSMTGVSKGRQRGRVVRTPDFESKVPGSIPALTTN